MLMTLQAGVGGWGGFIITQNTVWLHYIHTTSPCNYGAGTIQQVGHVPGFYQEVAISEFISVLSSRSSLSQSFPGAASYPFFQTKERTCNKMNED